MARERLRVREISNEEGNRLLRIVRRSSGSVVTWRRAQMVLLSAQGMDVEQISKVAFTSADRVRDVINNFNDDGFDSLYPRYAGGRPPTFTLPQRQQVKRIALARPMDHGLPFSTWSLTKLAEFLVAEGVVDDISHEGLRDLLRKEGVSFQVIKTFKQSNDPDYEAKKNRVLELYDIADGKVEAGPGDPTVVLCVDEFGPLNLLPRPGKQWAPMASGKGSKASPRRRRRRATYTRTQGVRHLMAALDLGTDKMYGHVKVNQEPDHLPGLLPLPAVAAPERGAHRHRHGQLQPPPVDPQGSAGGRVGGGQQRRVGLRAHQLLVDEPDRVPVPGVALLHPRWHRPPHPRGAELYDPPLHRLAQSAHPERRTSCYFNPRKRCLIRH
ncbi:MAG TPA: helix-turn-helix domain-containing protein [Acidimicrobiales bacterium]|nr:helix-turn-helix domain-containing protein [Acidimicrobiales bacterium]